MLRKLLYVGFALTVACGDDDRPPLDAAVDGDLPDAFSDARPDSRPDASDAEVIAAAAAAAPERTRVASPIPDEPD